MEVKPKEVLDFCEKNAVGHRQFAEWLDENNGNPVLRTYIYKKIRGTMICHEIWRRYFKSGISYAMSSLYQTYMGGYNIVWEQGQKLNMQAVFEPLPVYDTRFERPTNWGDDTIIWGERLYDEGKVFSVFCKMIPHFYLDSHTFSFYEKYNCGKTIFDYCRNYLKYPLCEMLEKFGLGYLTANETIYKLKKDTIYRLLSYIKQHKQEVQSEMPTLNQIRIACKYPELTLKNIISEGWKTPKEKEIGIYCKKQNCSVSLYKDYLDMANQLKLNIRNNETAYPGHLKNEHDRLCNLIDMEERTPKMRDNLKNFSSRFSEAKATINGYELYVPSDVDDFANQANKLVQCLIKCKYDFKMADRKEVLVFIKKEGKPVATAEYLPDKNNHFAKISQFYASHDTKPNQDIVDTMAYFDRYVWQKIAKAKNAPVYVPPLPNRVNNVCGAMMNGVRV